MLDFIRGHPDIIVNGLICAGITAAFDGDLDLAMHLGKESKIKY